MPKACPRAMLFPPTLAARDEGAALPFPPGTASPHRALLETCALHTARLCTARHRLVEAPTCSASPQPAGRERARRAHAQSCSSRATACPSLEYLLWTDPPSPGCVLQASPRGGQPSATPQLPCSLTQRLRSSLQCPARSSRCCHPPPDPCRTLGQPLCARCGGDPPDLWSPLGSFPAAALLPIV
jgi:hypothetical protein